MKPDIIGTVCRRDGMQVVHQPLEGFLLPPDRRDNRPTHVHDGQTTPSRGRMIPIAATKQFAEKPFSVSVRYQRAGARAVEGYQ